MEPILATVIHSFPACGLAVVAPVNEAPSGSSMHLASFQVNDISLGVSPLFALPAGSTVMCLPLYDSALWVIVSVVNTKRTSHADSITLRCLELEPYMAGMKALSTLDICFINNLLPSVPNDLLTNRSNGMLGDSLPGDYDIFNRRSITGLHIGTLEASLFGSPLARISAYGNTNEVSILASRVRTDTPVAETVNDIAYTVSNKAVALNEALGTLTDKVFKDSKRGLPLENDHAIPLYRLQHIEGFVSQGEESIIVGCPSGDVHDATTPVPILSRRRFDLSGTVQEESAHCIQSVKTLHIPGILQLGYGEKPISGAMHTADTGTVQESVFDDLREPYAPANLSDDVTSTADEETAITDAAINKLVGTLLNGAYKKAMLKILAEHGFKQATDANSLVITEDTSHVCSGPISKQFYDTPPKVTVTDKVTGRATTYYDTSSFISQEPDGSICICDGYGSEIRMCRGNIYISPALDLVFRPGRDLWSMTPRHQAFESMDTCTISTDTSMYLHAAKDMKTVSGTSGTGSYVIDSRANSENTAVVLRSSAGVAITAATDMYIGRNSLTGTSTAEATVTTAGNIIIDAGAAGHIRTHANHIHEDAESTVTLSVLRESASSSVFSLTAETAQIISGSIAVSGDIKIAPLATSVELNVFRNGAITVVTLPIADDTPNVCIGGMVTLDGNLTVEGKGVFKGTADAADTSRIGLITNGIVVDSADKNNAMTITGLGSTSNSTFVHTVLEGVHASLTHISVTSQSIRTASGKIYNDRFILNSGFAFPASYGITGKLTIPGIVWQYMGDTTTKKTWSVSYVKPSKSSDGPETACYPGAEIWKSMYVSAPGYLEKSVKDGGYSVNVPSQGE